MSHKGLSKEKIIETAAQLIETKGYKEFTIRGLAAALNIKPASLYNHIASLDELSHNIALKAIAELKNIQEEAIQNK